jgi:hypothetical protein
MAPVIAAYLYPSDVVGDPAAPERLRAMGIREVTLAAVYHATRAITPRHPRHRIVVADHTAAYIPLAPDRWRDAAIVLPAVDDTFIAAAQALRDHDMSVHTWVVRRRPRECTRQGLASPRIRLRSGRAAVPTIALLLRSVRRRVQRGRARC